MSKMSAKKRLQIELKKSKKNPISGAKVSLKKSNIKQWNVIITGPEKTPYAGGKFKFFFSFPEEYPFKPPNVKCETKVYHPNFDNKEGKVCGVDLLTRDGWSPMCGVREAVVGIQQLLREPNAGHPLDDEIAKVFESNKSLFTKNAKSWTKKHAK